MNVSLLIKNSCLASPRQRLTDIRDALLDIAFPRTCAVCGADPAPGYLYLCWECRALLPLIQPPFCDICGQPAAVGTTQFTCSACRRRRPYFDRARSVLLYHGPVRKLVHDFKYHRALWLRHDFNILLQAAFAAHYHDHQIDAVTFVPLSPWRARIRSFNQSRILGTGLAGPATGLPLVKGLSRIKTGATQTHLTAGARIANVKDVFKAVKGQSLAGKKLLLIDDVMTTGATVNECARELKQAGAAGIYILTLARGG